MSADPIEQEDDRVDHILARALATWVRAVRRNARAVLWGAALLTAAAGAYAVTHLGINTHHTAIVDDDLAFWDAYNDFGEVFPIVDEALLVVVDAESPACARDATRALAAAFEAQPDFFERVYVPGGSEFFERNALLYLEVDELEDLSDNLAAVQPLLAEVSRDRSLTNLADVVRQGIEHAEAGGEMMDMSVAFDSLSNASSAVLLGRPRPVSWSELLMRRKLPGDSARRVIVLHPLLDYDHLLPGSRVITAVRETVDRLGLDADTGVNVRITGNVALNTEEMVQVALQTLYAVGGCIFLVGAVLFVALRSWRVAIGILGALIAGLVWTAAFAAVAVGSLNVISIAFAVLFIGLGVDFGIHLGMRFAELVRDGSDDEAALVATVSDVGGSVVLCAFTTAMGFFVFLPTPYAAVAQLGLISGVGMIISLFCSLTVLPALLVAVPGGVGRVWRGATAFEAALVGIAVRHPHSVRRVALVAAVLAGALVPLARFDHNVVNMRDPSTESAQTFYDLLEESETSPWTIDVMTSSLDEARETANRLRTLEVVEHAVTLADYVPADQEEKLEILEDLVLFVPPPPPVEVGESPPLADQIEALRALQGALQSSALQGGDPDRAASAQRAAASLERFLVRLERIDRKQEELDAFEASLTGALPDQMQRLWRALEPESVAMDDLPPGLTRRMLAPDGRARVEVLPSENLRELDSHTRFVDEVQAVVPHATGSAVALLEWTRVVASSFQQALSLAVVAVTLLLWLLWRRLDDVLLVLLPLSLAALLTVATTVLLGMRFNFANVIVLPLLLGIGVDSGIHLVHRHRLLHGREMESAHPEAELLGTSTAQAVLFSALTTMGSFGSLALSTHPGLASLGLLLLIGVAYTLLCNLVVLPALIARKAVR
jgi:hopanoid biosynthesis associated RND transporter like protein HpnN